MFAVQVGLQKFNIPHKFEIKTVFDLYAEWIREGKLKVSSDWNKNIKAKFTLHDPCQLVRKTFGDPMGETMRFVLKACVGEENFIDMVPNRSNNFCCGGGGGALQAGYLDERLAYGRKKLDQIKSTGAKYVVTPCHNCHSQMHDMADRTETDYHSLHLWTIICLAMGCLGENERTYLGTDLAEVGL